MLPGLRPLRELREILGRDATAFVRVGLVAVLLLVIGAAVLSALGPVALKLLIDDLTGQAHQRFVSPLLLVALYALSQWLARAAGEVRGFVYGRVERRILRTTSERLFAHLMHLPLRFHLERRTGAVSETLNNALDGLQMILHYLAFTVLPVIAELATALAVLAYTAPPPLLVLFCGALMLYASAFAYSASTLSDTARSASAARVDAGAVITDGLLNYETVKYFTAESILQERVAGALARSETEWVLFHRKYARNGVLVASIFAAFLAATTWYSALTAQSHRMTIGDFVLVNAYMLQLVRPVEMLGYALQGFTQGFAMLEAMLGLFREAPEQVQISAESKIKDRGSLEFSQVTVSYCNGHPVLRNVSFRIEPKHTLAIVGPSGSGKSTIVRLIARLLEPDEGRILLDDTPIARLALSGLRNAIAVVPQDTLLLNDTVAFNISFGRAGATLREIQEAARVARLHDFIMSLPEGYGTPVGERGVKLSGGEKQRVSIARAVLKAPQLYVFDEATSSLDSRTEQDILISLREIAQHSSTLVIAHRLSTVIHADEIVVLDHGSIVECGTHQFLLGQHGRYAELWRAQHQESIMAERIRIDTT
jgi:ABC-type transport system involved in Fe-S cluster assembly fused permease/ATPase subunit